MGILALVLTACRSLGREAWERVPLAPEGREQTTVREGPVLHIDRVRFRSTVMRDTRFFLVVVPNGADTIGNVVIINHGWRDRPEDLLEHLPIEQVYTDLLAKHEVPRAILVIPDIRVSGSFRRETAHRPENPVSAYVANEVVPLVEEYYSVPPVRRRWGIGGFSFGGFVALDVGRRHPDRFGSVSVISSFYNHNWTFWPDRSQTGSQIAPVPGEDKELVGQPRLMLACGTSDRFFGEMQALHERFVSAGIQHDWHVGSGGHTWKYWSTVVEAMLVFHLGAMTGTS